MQASSGAFQTFGIQCDYVLDPAEHEYRAKKASLDHSQSTGTLFSKVGSNLINESNSGCKAYTYASLHNVRRIRISCGSEGRPRHSYEVSGLWFDYFTSQRPSIVGQWISEVEVFTIDNDERLVELTLWVSKARYSFNKKYSLGRVIRVLMVTSYNRSIAVPSNKPLLVDNCVALTFRQNRLESLVRENDDNYYFPLRLTPLGLFLVGI